MSDEPIDITYKHFVPNSYNAEAELAGCDDYVKERCRKMGVFMAGVPTQMQLVESLRQIHYDITELITVIKHNAK